MQTSSQPKLLPIPFAEAGSRQDIPNDSQVGIVAGRASYNDGFPPLTRTPLAAGGVPPFGTDFNGVFNDITAAIRWSQAGAGYPFNSAFNTAVAGYPKGARVPNSTLDGFWLNTTDGNSVNPENTTSSLTGWVPSGVYGTTSITGLSGSSVTLTTLQASKDRITLAGTLTANINLVVPAWIKRWEIINNCTGAFSVTVKTPGGSGVAVPAGRNLNVIGDGSNINNLYSPGTLIAVQIFPTSATYNRSQGATWGIIEVVGGGASGGGATAGSSTSNSCGGGGGAGAYAMALITSLPATAVVTVGTAGIGVAGAAGVDGGQSSFGTYVVCPGGKGGGVITASNALALAGGSTSSDAPTISGASELVSYAGQPGTTGIMLSGQGGQAGNGSSSTLGSGGRGAGLGVGSNSSGKGSGGGGSLNINTTSVARAGGNGSAGFVRAWEYA